MNGWSNRAPQATPTKATRFLCCAKLATMSLEALGKNLGLDDWAMRADVCMLCDHRIEGITSAQLLGFEGGFCDV